MSPWYIIDLPQQMAPDVLHKPEVLVLHLEGTEYEKLH